MYMYIHMYYMYVAGNGCTAYDVIINSDFYTKTQERPILLNFILTLILEGIEQKNSVLLSRGAYIHI